MTTTPGSGPFGGWRSPPRRRGATPGRVTDHLIPNRYLFPPQWTLGDELRAVMAANGHSIQDVAGMTGTSRAYVTGWCEDRLDPWPENVDALTEYLDVDVDVLVALVVRAQIRRAGGHERRTAS